MNLLFYLPYLFIFFRTYMVLVVMFFVANVFNNYAFDFNIPMPLHMIFRAVCWITISMPILSLFSFVCAHCILINDFNSLQGSLIANMIMGIILLKKSYRLDKYISVGMITLGIVICTVVSGSNVVSDSR